MSEKTKKKLWPKIVAAGLIAIVLLLILSLVFINSILKGAVETVGSTVTKSEVSIEKVKLSLLGGKLRLAGFKVGNPEGYKTDEAFSLGQILVSLQPSSLLSDTIVIKEIDIVDPALTYEVGLGNSNLGTILDNVKSFVPEPDPDKPEKEKPPKSEKEGKQVVIERVSIRGGKVRLSAKLMGGAALPIPLPGVELTDIGKKKSEVPDDEEKLGMIEAAAVILHEMLTGAIKAVGSGAKDLLKGGRDLVEESGKAVIEGGKTAVEEAGKAASEAGKAVAEGGKAALEGAVEGGKKLGQGLLHTIGVGSKKEDGEK